MTTTKDSIDEEFRTKLLSIKLPAYYRYESVNAIGRYGMLHPDGIDELLDVIQDLINKKVLEARYSAEIWKPYPYASEYEISSSGRVRRNGKVLAQSNQSRKPNTYKLVTISKDNVRKSHTVHRLVAETFLLNKENKKTVNHKNGDKSDNTVNNLEWATYQENNRHAFDVLGKVVHNKGKKFVADYCPKGHEFSESNSYYHEKAGRICRTCHNERERIRKARNRLKAQLESESKEMV